MKSRDARVLDFISSYLSDGKSSKLYKKIVDDKKKALQIGAVGFNQEDYGMYILYGLPMTNFTNEDLLKEIDEEIVKIQNELISEKDYQKLLNQFENQYVNQNSNVEGIAENLAKYYLLYDDVNLINTDIDIYHSITREEIRAVAQKYLNPNQRLLLDYIPSPEKNEN
jgi:predicted Zn-dependent peptidase